MILADKIIMLRKKSGWSQEELAEKLDVSRQSVSKWEGGLSIPDLNKIIAMSALFGVSTDYLLKDELEKVTPSETSESDDASPMRTVDTETANRYMNTVERLSKRIALGVALCILSPVCLILLGGMVDEGAVWLGSENIAVSIGLTVLFLLVGIAVAIFIPCGLQLSEFSYLEKERFTLAYGVRGIVEKKREAYKARYCTLITVGIVLCIFSVIPMLVFGMMEADGMILVACTAFILALCSFAVALIVRACYVEGSYEKLLQTGEFSEQNKKKTRENEAIDTAYWCLFTAIYLGVSFWTFDWHITWIVWPVAGCLFPVFQYLVNTIRQKK